MENDNRKILNSYFEMIENPNNITYQALDKLGRLLSNNNAYALLLYKKELMETPAAKLYFEERNKILKHVFERERKTYFDKINKDVEDNILDSEKAEKMKGEFNFEAFPSNIPKWKELMEIEVSISIPKHEIKISDMIRYPVPKDASFEEIKLVREWNWTMTDYEVLQDYIDFINNNEDKSN